MTDIVYPSEEAFFAADERRRKSGESDLGVWWKGDDHVPGAYGPWWRVSIVRDTGEIYAMNQWTDEHRVLGKVPVGDTDRTWDDPAHEILTGWAQACGNETIDWVRRRVTAIDGEARVDVREISYVEIDGVEHAKALGIGWRVD